MYKLAEQLFEKFLSKKIYQFAYKRSEELFESVFNECCEVVLDNQTTIGDAYDRITEIVFKEVKKDIDSKIEEVSWGKDGLYKLRTCDNENEFFKIVEFIWDDFLDYLDKNWIEETVRQGVTDAQVDREDQLYEQGIIDEQGCFINPNEVTRG